MEWIIVFKLFYDETANMLEETEVKTKIQETSVQQARSALENPIEGTAIAEKYPVATPTFTPAPVSTMDEYGCNNPDLTPEEKANCGKHTYKRRCQLIDGTNCSCDQGDTHEITNSFIDKKLVNWVKSEKISMNKYSGEKGNWQYETSFNNNGFVVINTSKVDICVMEFIFSIFE